MSQFYDLFYGSVTLTYLGWVFRVVVYGVSMLKSLSERPSAFERSSATFSFEKHHPRFRWPEFQRCEIGLGDY
jgi:hypothetical protein